MRHRTPFSRPNLDCTVARLGTEGHAGLVLVLTGSVIDFAPIVQRVRRGREEHGTRDRSSRRLVSARHGRGNRMGSHRVLAHTVGAAGEPSSA